LHREGLEVDRRILADMAVRDPGAFATLVRLVSDGDDAGASEKAAAVVAAATEAVAAADEAEVTADAERSDESEVSEEAAS
jgi:hypothetical protein